MNLRARIALALAPTAVAVALVACSSDPPDPQAERTRLVAERLELTFSRSQSTCIIEQLEPDTVTALADEGDLEPDTVAMLDYTDALSVCVIDGGEPDDEGG